MTNTPHPNDTITIDDKELRLVVRQQTRPGVWWALDASGKTRGVKCGDDGWEWAQ